MSEAEARALGAGTTITVNGDEYMLRPIEVRHLCDLERAALEYYKDQYIATFARSAKYLGDDPQEVIRKEVATAASWGLDDLPKRIAYDVRRLPITDELREWAGKKQSELDDEESNLTDDRIRALVVTALDREDVSVEEVQKMTGRRPRQGKVRYDNWWVTGAMEGMVAFLFTSIRYEHPDLKKSDVMAWPVSAIFEGARKVEEITAPSMGNG